MAKDLNKVMLTGRLGKDVDLRYTKEGTAVATFSVASGRNIRDASSESGWKEETEWFRVVAWKELAERYAEYLKKGCHVLVEGRLQTRKWVDKNNQERYTTEVIANDVMLLDSKRSLENGESRGSGASASTRKQPPVREENYFEDDEGMGPEDIPF